VKPNAAIRRPGDVLRNWLVALALALALVGCGAAEAPSASPTAQQIALRTQPPAGPNQACMEALATGRLAADARAGLAIRAGTDVIPVVWPNGYTAWLTDSGIVLLDATGRPIAREGDQVALGGGFGADGFWYPCDGQLTVVDAGG
jgi:hypothetical protein